MMDTTLHFPEFCTVRTFSGSEIHLNFQQVLWQDLKSAHNFYQLPNVLVYCSIQHLTPFLLSLVKETFHVYGFISVHLSRAQ